MPQEKYLFVRPTCFTLEVDKREDT